MSVRGTYSNVFIFTNHLLSVSLYSLSNANNEEFWYNLRWTCCPIRSQTNALLQHPLSFY